MQLTTCACDDNHDSNDMNTLNDSNDRLIIANDLEAVQVSQSVTGFKKEPDHRHAGSGIFFRDAGLSDS